MKYLDPGCAGKQRNRCFMSKLNIIMNRSRKQTPDCVLDKSGKLLVGRNHNETTEGIF